MYQINRLLTEKEEDEKEANTRKEQSKDEVETHGGRICFTAKYVNSLPAPTRARACKVCFLLNAMLQFSHFDPLFPNVLPNMLQIFHIMLAKLVENTKTSMRQKKRIHDIYYSMTDVWI